jgi:hypothetical protein
MKKVFSVPSWSFDTIFEVDAELQPPPPADDTVVVAVSRFKSFTTAGSSFILDWTLYLRIRFSIDESLSDVAERYCCVRHDHDVTACDELLVY